MHRNIPHVKEESNPRPKAVGKIIGEERGAELQGWRMLLYMAAEEYAMGVLGVVLQRCWSSGAMQR